MADSSSTLTSKGQLVIPAALRRKHGIAAGTRIKFTEDQFGRIVLQPVTVEYIDRVMGCLRGGTDLVAKLKAERRREGKAGR